MKKSVKFVISGSIQPMIFNNFMKENADRIGVKGFVRQLGQGKAEVFIEGNIDSVNQMIPLCKKGPQHSMIKNVDEKVEHFQDFKDFKILNF